MPKVQFQIRNRLYPIGKLQTPDLCAKFRFFTIPQKGIIMKVFDSENIRNIAVVGHGDAGKTSLVSAMLYSAGAVNRLGRVEEGNTVTDYDEDEIQRRITINTALIPASTQHTAPNIPVESWELDPVNPGGLGNGRLVSGQL